MRRRLSTYLLICALVAFVSCEKDRKATDVGLKDETIELSPREAVSTKALMDNAELHTNGNKMRVFDILSGFSGTVSWMDEGNPYYINDEIVYNGNAVWEYTSGRKYPWTVDGSHIFFGWLSYDSHLAESDTQFCSDAYDAANQILSIPIKEMNTATDQFDFMYSTVKYVDAEDHVAGSPVPLELKHLFTAFNLTLNNTSDNRIYLKRVTLSGMKNVRSAQIAFTSNIPTVTTSDISSTDIVLFESPNISGDPAGTLFESVDAAQTLSDFMLMWPQSYVDLSGAQLVVEYNILDASDQLSEDLSSTIILDKQNVFKTNSVGMDAGTKYTFLLEFRKSTIVFDLKVLPWEYESYEWDYSDHSVSARSGTFRDGVLAFYRYNLLTDAYDREPTSDEWSAKTMRFNTRNEILKGRFYIESPTSGRWQISAYPLSAAQYFVIEPTSGGIDAFTDNGKTEFTISVDPNLTPSTTQTLYFNVAIYFNGEWHDANSEFNRKNFKLVLDAN